MPCFSARFVVLFDIGDSLLLFAVPQVGIKHFIVNLVIRKASSEEVFRRERVFMTKLNVILVQIVKQEWPVCEVALTRSQRTASSQPRSQLLFCLE